jgi:beta-N-acetylhexosaminidase
VNIDSRNELGTRIFSSDANVVANMVAAVSKGLKDTGVCATLKHFPGLGAESGNTHNDSFVVIDRSLEQLRETEFVAFKGGIDAGADLVMVGHQITTGFGDNLPADLSYVAITEMLRGELGFNGVVITDSQQMNTILNVYTSGQAAKMSVKAGADIILAPKSITEAIDAVCAAVESGEIPESRIDESALRILRLKKELGLF